MAKRGTKFEPRSEDRELVLLLAAGGITQDLIAACVKVSEQTLRTHFKRELTTGQRQVTAQAISTLVKAMKGGGRGAVAAACFWLKTREHWRETQVLEHEGQVGLSGDLKVIVEYQDPAEQK